MSRKPKLKCNPVLFVATPRFGHKNYRFLVPRPGDAVTDTELAVHLGDPSEWEPIPLEPSGKGAPGGEETCEFYVREAADGVAVWRTAEQESGRKGREVAFLVDPRVSQLAAEKKRHIEQQLAGLLRELDEALPRIARAMQQAQAMVLPLELLDPWQEKFRRELRDEVGPRPTSWGITVVSVAAVFVLVWMYMYLSRAITRAPNGSGPYTGPSNEELASLFGERPQDVQGEEELRTEYLWRLAVLFGDQSPDEAKSWERLWDDQGFRSRVERLFHGQQKIAQARSVRRTGAIERIPEFYRTTFPDTCGEDTVLRFRELAREFQQLHVKTREAKNLAYGEGLYEAFLVRVGALSVRRYSKEVERWKPLFWLNQDLEQAETIRRATTVLLKQDWMRKHLAGKDALTFKDHLEAVALSRKENSPRSLGPSPIRDACKKYPELQQVYQALDGFAQAVADFVEALRPEE